MTTIVTRAVKGFPLSWSEMDANFNNLNTKVSERISVKDFGAVGNGSHDDTASIQAAIDYVEGLSLGGQGAPRIYFPGGDYLISSTITINDNFIVLEGDGPRSSLIRTNSDFGDAIHFVALNPSTTSLACIGMENIGVRAFADTNSGALIRITRCIEVNFSNLSLRDNFGGILIEGGIQHYYNNIDLRSGGLWSSTKSGSYLWKIVEGPATQQKNPSEMFFSNINARNTGTPSQDYVEFGFMIYCCDGLWFQNCHTLSCNLAGMLIQPQVTALSPSGTQITGILASNFWFDGYCKFGLSIRGTSNTFGGFQFTNAFFLNADEYNVHVLTGCNVKGITFNGGTCLKAEYSGFYLYGGENYVINGMFISGNGMAGGTDHAGIEIGDGVSYMNVSGNRIGGTLLGGTTTTQTIGVYVNSPMSDFINVSGNIFSGHSNADIYDYTSGMNKIYENNNTDISIANITTSSNSLQIPMHGNYFEVDSGVTSITNLISRNKNRIVTLQFTGNCTVSHTSTQLELSGSANFSATAKDTLTLIYTGSKWIELARTVI